MALEILNGIPPIDLFLEEQGVCTRYRTKTLVDHDGWDGIGDKAKKAKRMGHRASWDKHLHCIPETVYPCDDISPVINWERNMEIIEPDINIFTDGSKMNDEAGYGWAITSKNNVIDEGFEYLGNDEVYTSELAAIHDVCWWVINNKTSLKEKGQDKALIHTDSQSSLQAIFAPYIKSQLVLDCKNLINTCNQFMELGIQWVKGHSEITGNEFADFLAKSGAEKGGLVPEPPGPISKNKVKKAIKTYFDKKWQKRWDRTEHHRVSKRLLPKVDRKLCKILPKRDIHTIQEVVSHTTGHGMYAKFLRKQHSEIPITCKLCDEEGSIEDPVHIWFHCPRVHRDPERHELTLENIINLFKTYKVKQFIFDVNERWLENNIRNAEPDDTS
jgi:ribonuclease HI